MIRRCKRIPPLLWIILSLLAASENGQTLLSDPHYDESTSSAQSSNLELEGATAEARGEIF